MDGLTIVPNTFIDNIAPHEAALLILPGGEAWERKELREVIALAEDFREENIPVAAIYGATTFLANIGWLDNCWHTSNDQQYLISCYPQYGGELYYSDEPAITDGKLITASGIAPIEFAREIFRMLHIYDEDILDKWYQVFKHGIWAE